MKRNIYLIACIALCISLCITSCKKEKIKTDNPTQVENQNPEPQGDGIIHNAVKDYDGNTYDAVKIGNQVWMATNIRTTHYANGAAIDEGSTTSYQHPYYYKRSGDPASFGYLYNWKAAVDGALSSESNPSGVKGVCPDGWHVPSDAEFDELTDYCKSKDEYSCGELISGFPREVAKSLAADYEWDYCDRECTVGYDPSSNNLTGFGAIPTGFYIGVFTDPGRIADFWGATGCDGCTYAYEHYILYNSTNMYRVTSEKNVAYPVRCVKD